MLINELVEGAMIIDCTGKIIDCNHLAANQLGYFREAIVGQDIQNYLYDDIEPVLHIRTTKKVILNFRNRVNEPLEVAAKVGYQPCLGDEAVYIIMESIHHNADYREKVVEIEPYEEVYQQYTYLKTKYHPKLFREICNNVSSKLDIRILGIYLYDQRQDCLVLQAGIGLSDDEFSKLSALSFRRSLAGAAYMEQKHQKIVLNDHINPLIKSIVETSGADMIESFPIYFEDEILGVMSYGYHSVEDHGDIDYSVVRKEADRIGLFAKSLSLNQRVSKELAQRLEVEAEMALFFQYTRDFVFIMDEAGGIKRVGEALAKAFGYGVNQVSKIEVFDFFQGVERDVLLAWIKGIRTSEVGNDLLIKTVGMDGKSYWISWNGQYLFERGMYFFSGRDVTELKEREERQRLLEQAVVRENVKNEFFTNISHEFRTPINILLSSIQLLENKKEQVMSGDEFRQAVEGYLPLMRQNSYRLLRLVNNILDLTKMDAGQYRISLENQDIVSTVENVALSVAEYIESHGMRLIFDTDVEEKIIACNPDKIERIMLNLLSNAVKYSGDGSLIEVMIEDGDEYITITVQDNGVGISEGQQMAIFDRFMQIDGSLTRRTEGSGIGLAIVKSLVEIHQGTIEIKSKVDQGTRFIMRFPNRQLDEEQEKQHRRHKPRRSVVELCNVEFSDIYE